MFFIQQANNHDCGFTCLKILLANIHHDRNYLFLKDPFKEETSFLDLVNLASNYKVELIALKAEAKEEITNIQYLPIIAHVNINNTSHAVYVYKVNKKYVYYFDPSRGEKKISIDEFINMWDAKFLAVKEFNKLECPIKKPKLMNNKEIAISLVFSFISVVSTFLAIYFINKDAYIFIPLIFFTLMLISEILQKSYSINVMHHIDKRVEEMTNKIKNKEYYDFYLTNEGYKKCLLINNLTFFSSFSVFIIISLIFIINDKMNIIYILINLLFAFSYALFINPELNKEEKEIIELESNIKKKDDTLEAFSNMKEAREKSYKYVNKEYLYKYIVIAFEVILTFILMIYNKIVNVTYIICYTVLQIYLYSNIVTLLTNNDNLSKQDNLLNKMIDMMEKE